MKKKTTDFDRINTIAKVGEKIEYNLTRLYLKYLFLNSVSGFTNAKKKHEINETKENMKTCFFVF